MIDIGKNTPLSTILHPLHLSSSLLSYVLPPSPSPIHIDSSLSLQKPCLNIQSHSPRYAHSLIGISIISTAETCKSNTRTQTATYPRIRTLSACIDGRHFGGSTQRPTPLYGSEAFYYSGYKAPRPGPLPNTPRSHARTCSTWQKPRMLISDDYSTSASSPV